MNDPVLLTRVERENGGKLRVLSPHVGIWSGHPHLGALVGPGSHVGALLYLNRRFALLLPDGAAGVVHGTLPADRAVAVEYGGLLFELSPLGDGVFAASSAAGALGRIHDGSLAAGTWAVVSPTDGTFYRRSSPGAAAFVEVGSRVRQGQPVGLVEVMKTFNQVLYGGSGLPEEAEVLEVRCSDAEEVRAGQVLIVVR